MTLTPVCFDNIDEQISEEMEQGWNESFDKTYSESDSPPDLLFRSPTSLRFSSELRRAGRSVIIRGKRG